MLIGGGVIDHLDPELLNGAGHELAVEHRSEHRGHGGGAGHAGLGLFLQAPLELLDLHGDIVERDLGQLE